MTTHQTEPAAFMNRDVPQSPERLYLSLPKKSLDASLSQSQCPTPSREEDDPTLTHPFSAFYSHPTTRTSSEQLKNCSTVALKVYETDIESGSKRFSMEPTGSHLTQTKDCSVWPSMQTLKQEKKQRKKRAGCYPWNLLNKKQRLWTRVILVILSIGCVIGLAVGITKAVGGGVYKTPSQSAKIGSS